MAETSIGIDLGGTKIEGVVLDPEHNVQERKRIATESERGYEGILERMTGLICELRDRAGGTERIGIGTPGALSATDGTLKNSNTLCLNGKPLKHDLEARLGLEVRMENDANCFALAEAVAGAGRGHEMVFGVILGTGVGGGIVWNGKLWAGPQHIGGEWGHHVMQADGPTCYCGHRGCVETLLSGPALEGAYRAAGGDPLGAAEIADAAVRGQSVAESVMRQYIEHFGRALANLIDILDPSAVVLGGGLSNLEVLYTEGRDAVERNVFNDRLQTPILKNQLGDSAGVIGAALLCD